LGRESLTNWSDYPHLLADLDLRPGKNEDLTHYGKPIHVLEKPPTTHFHIDWKCSTCEHEWRTTGWVRYMGARCPACSNGRLHSDGRNSMALTHPELALEYQGDATKIVAGTNKKLDWKCLVISDDPCGYEWTTSSCNRIAKRGASGCRKCAIKENTFKNLKPMSETHPDLAIEYQEDATKVVAGSHKRGFWKCLVISDDPCGHEWATMTKNRSRNGSGCPYCNHGDLHIDGRNSMAMTHPHLAAEYQGDATKLIAGTHKKLDWKCSICYHIWNVSGGGRVYNETGCPACINMVVNNFDGRNSMATTHPKLAEEYQGDATIIVAGVRKKLLWKCSDCEHKWKTTGDSRANGVRSGCPICSEGGGFKVGEPAYCYLLKYQFSGGTIRYKQGISGDVKVRVAKLSWEVNKVFPETKVTLIDQKYFEVGQDARDLETYFLSLMDIRWTPDKKFDGSTEMYAEGILEAWAERL
jgi:DNA-directed RNA polymerase subunit RPC12/RpoP